MYVFTLYLYLYCTLYISYNLGLEEARGSGGWFHSTAILELRSAICRQRAHLFLTVLIVSLCNRFNMFNAKNGFCEAYVRGCQFKQLCKQHYAELSRCETLEDVKTYLVRCLCLLIMFSVDLIASKQQANILNISTTYNLQQNSRHHRLL